MDHTPDPKSELLLEQIERRRQRGLEDLAKIVNRGQHPVYSVFEVTSTTDRNYTVQIRSLTEQLNTCTCPDYRTNTIGTCKHIEGVLANLEKEFTEQWEEFVSQAPPISQVYVRHAERTTVRVTMPRDSSSFNRWSIIFLLAPPSMRARSLKRTGPSFR